MAMFSTTGIRGIANRDMRPEFVLKLATTFGNFLGNKGSILVGNDTRTSSEMLKSAAISGLLACGLNVLDAGLAPIPAITYTAKERKLPALMITSSHNPPEYNGIKFILKTGLEISDKGEGKFEKLYSGKKEKASWKKIGTYSKEDILTNYKQALKNSVDSEKIKKSRLKVAIDPANGAQSVLIPELLSELGCEIIKLHTEPKGIFSRDPEPAPETLYVLREAVTENKADLGVGYDIDGDRAIFVTENGEVLMGDVTGTLLAHEILKKKGKIVTPVSSSKQIDDVAEKIGGKVIRTKVGAKYVANTILEKKALFGFEENGGCIFPKINLARDGALTTVKILELLANSGKTFSELVAELPYYFQLKTKVQCPHDKKNAVMKKVNKSINTKKLTLDGVKAIFKDGAVLIRASGTEPAIRIFAEARTEKRVQEIMDWAKGKVKKAL